MSEPFGLTIAFSDGTVSQAELVQMAGGTDIGGQAAVIVNAYATAAGTDIPEKTWIVVCHVIENGVLNLQIGRQIRTD